MIFRLSVFCCGLSHNMWEKIVGNEWLEEKQCQRRNNCFNSTIRGKREHVLRIFCSTGFLKGSTSWSLGDEKGAGLLLGVVFVSISILWLQATEPTRLSCRNCISRTVGNSGITREGREGALRRVRSQDNPRSLSQQWLNISCFCLFVFFNLCYTAFKIQDSRKKNQTVLYESLFHP